MSQGFLLGNGKREGSLGKTGPKMHIKVPHFDNSELIADYSKTVIGRCMNPRMQYMKSLLLMLPRIWQLEGKVVGADLGLGKFQFDFDDENDIVEVLKMEPFHFDHWMVSLVRWAPTVDPSYPSVLKFWIRVFGVPLKFWADPTFRSIGKAFGTVEAVDIDGGRVQVTVDGFKPICFESVLEFGNGEETVISFKYERLFGYCKNCFSLCHDVSHCNQRGGWPADGKPDLPRDDGEEKQMLSYRGAVVSDRQRQNGGDGRNSGDTKGKTGAAINEEAGYRSNKGHAKEVIKGNRPRYQGEGSSRHARVTSYAHVNDYRLTQAEVKGLKAQKQWGDGVGKGGMGEDLPPPKQVRKALFLETVETGVAGFVEDAGSQIGTAMENNTRQGLAGVENPKSEVDNPEVGEEEAVELALIRTNDQQNKGTSGKGFEIETEDGEVEPQHNDTQVQVTHGTLQVELPGKDEDGIELSGKDLDGLETSNDGGAVAVDGGNIEGEEECLDLMETDSSLISSSLEGEAASPIEICGMQEQEGTKKKGNGPLVFKGIGSRKRNVQILATPRKKFVVKNEVRFGEGLYPKHQEVEKGRAGGPKPPKPEE